MKVKDIRLGQQYAVQFAMPPTPGLPRTAPMVFATCVDIAGNTIILDFSRSDCGLHGEALDRLRTQQRRVGSLDNLPTGRTLIRVPHGDVLCPADEWQTPGPPDGRLDGDVPMGGGKARTHAQTRLALL